MTEGDLIHAGWADGADLVAAAPLSGPPSGVAAPQQWFLDALGGSATTSGVRVNSWTALSANPIAAAVKILSEDIAKLPIRLYKTGRKGRELMVSHPVLRLLARRPNRWMTPFDFKATMVSQYALNGNAIAIIKRDIAGRATELVPVETGRVALWTGEGELFYYVSFTNEINRLEFGTSGALFSAADILHVKWAIGWQGLWGYSPIQMGRETIANAIVLDRYAGNLYANYADVGGVLKHPGMLGDEAYKRLRKQWEDRYTGEGNRGRTAILEEGMSFEKMSMTAQDAEFVSNRKFSVEEAARMYRIPPHKLMDLTRTIQCLPAGQMVHTSGGPRPIESLQKGDRVWSMSPAGDLQLKPVLRAEKTGGDDILELRTRNRTLRCNAKHRVLVRRRTLRPFAGGRGTCIVGADGQRYRTHWENAYVSAGELKPGDFLVAATATPEFGSDVSPTRRVTVRFMELLGMLLGDGFWWRHVWSKKLGGFGISHAVDSGSIEYYASIAEEEFANVRMAVGEGAGRIGRRRATDGVTRVRRDANTTIFYSNLAAAELDDLGIVGLARTKRVPTWVFGLRRDLQLGLLRGYLDADGTVNDAGVVRLNSVSRDLLADMQQLCIACAIPVGSVYDARRPTRWGDGEYYGLCCGQAASNVALAPNDPAKRVRINAAAASNRPKRTGAWRVAGDGLEAKKIISIKPSGHEAVYNIAVLDNANYVAQGVVVKNSNIEEQSKSYIDDTLGPIITNFEDAYTDKLLMAREPDYIDIEHDVSAFVRGRPAERWDYYTKAIEHGVLSPNEVRVLEGMEEVEGGDEFYRNNNMVPRNQPVAPPVAASPQQQQIDEDTATVLRRAARRANGHLVQ